MEPTNPHDWITRCMYLEKVDGHKIVKAQDEINDSTFRFTISSIPFRLGTNDGPHQLYDCFIFFKENKKLAPIQEKIVTAKGEDVTVKPLGAPINLGSVSK